MSSLKILSVQRASIYLRTLFKTAPPFKIIAPMTSHNEVAKGCSLSTCSKRNITPIAQPEIVSNTSQSCSLTTCPNKTPQEVITKPEIVSNSSQPCSLSTCPNKFCQQQVIAQPEIVSNTSQSCSLSTCPNKTPQEVVTKPENVSNASQPCSLSTCPYKNSSPIVQPEVVSNSSQPCSLSTCPNKKDLTEPNMVPDYLQPCSLSTCPNEHCSPLAKPEGQISSQPCCLSTCPHKNVQEPTAKHEIEPDSFGPCSLSTCPNEYCSSNAKPEGPISSQPCSLSTCPYKNVQQPTIQPEMGVSSSQPCSLSTCPTKNLVKPAMLTIVSQPCAFSTCPNKNQPPIVKPEIIPISPKPCSMCSCRKKKPCEQPVSPPHQTYKIVMIRHGESEWNQKNLFTGWYDTHLSCKGHQEAKRAGAALKKAGYCFDVAFTSVLSRANMTLNYVLKALNQEDMPIIRSWRLNERHYGALTGLNKAETAAKYGEEKVTIWRRSYDIPPPPMERNHPYYKEIVFDKRYANDPPRDEFPMFESLKLTLERTMPFWEDTIVPEIKNGFRVIIAAHGNSLRGLVKTIERMSDKQILGVNLPTGIPFYYILGEDMKALPGTTMQFLGDPETVKAAMDAVAKQGKKK